MQDFLAQVVVTFGDLLASLGYIVIGILARRLWLVVIMALVWAVVAYAVHLQDQLGVPFQELSQAIDWTQVQQDLPLRAGIALVISLTAWACMGLIIGSFRPSRRRREERAPRRDEEERRETLVPRAGPARTGAPRGGGRGGRMEPTLQAGSDDDVPPLPIGLRAHQSAPPPPPEPVQPSSSFDVVLPRDPGAAAAALRRLYGEDELRRLLNELEPPSRDRRD